VAKQTPETRRRVGDFKEFLRFAVDRVGVRVADDLVELGSQVSVRELPFADIFAGNTSLCYWFERSYS
jgi:hypothetical protein